VAEHDLEVRMPVEGSSEYHPQCRDCGVQVPSPSECGEGKISHGIEAAVRRVTNGRRWQLRMNEHRLAELGCRREEVVVDRVIEEAVARSAVDHGADVADARRSLELARDISW
jgi:hypothetical protein